MYDRHLDGSVWVGRPTTYESTGGGRAKKDDASLGPRKDTKRKRESPEFSAVFTIHSNFPEAKVLGDLDHTLPVRIVLPGYTIKTD